MYSISEIDKEVQLKEKAINDKKIPHRLNFLRSQYNDIKTKYELLISESKQRSSLIKDYNSKGKNLAKESKSIEDMLYTSKSIKDIDMLQYSFDKVKKDIEENDNNIYINLEAQENAKKLSEDYKLKLNELSHSYNTLKGEYNSSLNLQKENLSSLLEKRNTLLLELDKNLAIQYEEVKKDRGYGMSTLKGEICTGCGMSVPYIIISDIKKNIELQRCPNCERFLYFEKLTI